MDKARDYHKITNENEREPFSSRVKDRTHIQNLLTEAGLNPTDYTFSPLPNQDSAQESTVNYPSAFSSYSTSHRKNNQNILKPQSKSIFRSSRQVPFVEQPPPPPPQVYQRPPAEQLPSHNKDQAPPPQPQAPAPPPPPTTAQTGSALPSFLFNPSSANTQNSTSQPAPDMNRYSFSPRRTPPPPPSHFHSVSPHESNLSAEHYLRQINSYDNPPVKVVKPNTQNVVYRKEIRIRYLQPPTPPPPAPIIIREKHVPPIPPPSPLLIRERKPEARTPPPLTIRERPPTPPPRLEPYVIEKNLPPAPPQSRQIIIERLPTPPPKPRTVIFEKWLPYKKIKRPVLLQKAPPPEPVKPTRNVVIEYEPLKAFTVRRVIEEGVFRVDPHQYASYNSQSHSGAGDVRIVERIEDLPPPSEQLMRVLNEYNHPIQPHSSPIHSYDAHCNSNTSEHIPPSVQHLLAGTRPISNIDQLTHISRASSTPAYRPDRVLSPGYGSSVASPTIIPIRRRHSKGSNHSIRQYTPHSSPSRSHMDEVY